MNVPGGRPPRADGLFDTVAAFKERSQRRVGLDGLGRHLGDSYGIGVSSVTPLDAGVFKVGRRDDSAWVARVFPRDRPLAEVAADAALLAWLAECGFPAERPAVGDPVSVLADQGVLVTEWVEGEGCRGVDSPELFETLGDLLGRLHAMARPEDGSLPARPSGAWHSLSVDGGGKAADVDAAERLSDDLVGGAAPERAESLEAVRSIIRAIDSGEDLPQALTHPDLATPNVIRRADGQLALVDWTGAGTGPRVCSLGLLLWVTGGEPSRVEAVARGYRSHVGLEDEERRRLGGWCRGLGPVLAAWSIVYRDADPAPFARRMAAGLAHAEKTAALFCAQLDT